ncbi:DNA-processing protein DprA [bacterium]|nr:DNA-processing protein DprA [bacterium]
MKREKIDWIKLKMVPEIGPICFQKLMKYFFSPANVVSSSLSELENVEGIGKRRARTIWDNLKNVNIETELKLIEEHKIKIVTFNDSDYPVNLKSIYDPPFLLYMKGEFLSRDDLSIAVVGSRKATPYGRMVAEKISRDLVSMGITVISGLARGIDTLAHKGALAGGGRTIAVLGNGLSMIYPKENKDLGDTISQQGAVVSEFSMESLPERTNFPIRNRIISGLSLGTIVVEAVEKSGALITANLALQQGREVFAIPGNIFSRYSQGSHGLIKEGAKLVENVNDVIEEIKVFSKNFNIESREESNKTIQTPICSLNQKEQKIYDCVLWEPVPIDVIVQKCDLPVKDISSSLMLMEIKGLIKQVSGKMFIRKGI